MKGRRIKAPSARRWFNYLRYNDFGSDRDQVLVTDILFPNKYAMWRNAEIASFIQEKSADILVFRTDSFANVQFDVDYALMMHEQGFVDYNILIFDPRYNHLNQFNTRIDGTQWNGRLKASYLITRYETFDIKRYACIYHIFLMCFAQFNSMVYFPKDKQAIHLYPGGGYLNQASLEILDRRTKVVSTHPRTSRELTALGHSNFIELFGGTFLRRDDAPFPQKARNDRTLTVGFASMGLAAEKGTDHFVQLVHLFKREYPDSDAEFVSIGTDALDPAITHHAPMSMQDLLKFYRDRLDILVSMDTGVAYNGWPLGTEAALSGVVLASTDPHDARAAYDLGPDTVFCFTLSDLYPLANFVAELDGDRQALHRRSVALQSDMYALMCYEAQQAQIFKYLGI